MEAGISSLKIKRRMKSVFYVSSVVGAYRRALDAYEKDPKNYVFNPSWRKDLSRANHRQFTTGFFYHKPDNEDQNYQEVAGLQFRPAIQPGKLDRSSCSGAVRIVQKRPCRGVVEDAVPVIQGRARGIGHKKAVCRRARFRKGREHRPAQMQRGFLRILGIKNSRLSLVPASGQRVDDRDRKSVV